MLQWRNVLSGADTTFVRSVH